MNAPQNSDNTARGIAIIIVTMMIFACQDAVTKYLAQDYSAAQIIWVRYVLFALFALALARRKRPLRDVLRSKMPWLQLLRSLVIVVEIGIFVIALRHLPLADTHALMATFPLMVTALSAIFLGEAVGVRRWSAVVVGFLGVLIILRPGIGVFEEAALWALLSAFLFACYQVLTRVVGRHDDGETSLLYMAVVGAVVMSFIGPFYWTPPTAEGWIGLIVLTITGTIGHLFLIKALELAPASTLQPFNFTLLVWATVVGFLVFGEFPDGWTIAGAIVVASGGLYTIYRERIRKPPGARHRPGRPAV